MYNKELRERAIAMVKSGMTAREVSNRLGGRPCTSIIQRWANGYDPQGKRRTARLFTMEEKLKAVLRVNAGEDYQDVADELGCAGPTVLTWRRLYEEGGAERLHTRLDDLL